MPTDNHPVTEICMGEGGREREKREEGRRERERERERWGEREREGKKVEERDIILVTAHLDKPAQVGSKLPLAGRSMLMQDGRKWWDAGRGDGWGNCIYPSITSILFVPFLHW